MPPWTRVALVAAGALIVPYALLHAATLTFVSDLISTSAPSTIASHAVQFTVTDAIPPGGAIIITPEAGAFTIPPDLDESDIEFSVSSGGGPYVDRGIASSPDAVSDGISVVSGTSGSITITLNSTTGINAGDKVRIGIGTIGTDSIVNPGTVRSYGVGIETEDEASARIESANAMIAVVDPISLDLPTDLLRPTLFNGLPSGEVAAGNPTIELSLESEAVAECRYATSSGVAYSDMTSSFSPSGFDTLFYTTLTGFQDNTAYNFYVRCINNLGNPNDTDYVISFFLDPTPAVTTSLGTGEGSTTNEGPTGYLGPGGTGNIANGSAYLYLSSVTFSGWSIPLSTVTILKDSAAGVTTQANSDGTFQVTLNGLERGTYTFDAYAQDSKGFASGSYASTLAVGQGTQNNISNILIPPTLGLSNSAVAPGDPLQASGGAIPYTTIEVDVVSPSGSSTPQTYDATSSAAGAWQASIDTTKLARGTYVVSAREIKSDQLESEFGKPAYLTVGNSAGGSCSASTDMNHDGKVNLIDFSIFLTSWNTSTASADFNCDGQVNLADFSIMLFNWTG